MNGPIAMKRLVILALMLTPITYLQATRERVQTPRSARVKRISVRPQTPRPGSARKTPVKAQTPRTKQITTTSIKQQTKRPSTAKTPMAKQPVSHHVRAKTILVKQPTPRTKTQPVKKQPVKSPMQPKTAKSQSPKITVETTENFDRYKVIPYVTTPPQKRAFRHQAPQIEEGFAIPDTTEKIPTLQQTEPIGTPLKDFESEDPNLRTIKIEEDY